MPFYGEPGCVETVACVLPRHIAGNAPRLRIFRVMLHHHQTALALSVWVCSGVHIERKIAMLHVCSVCSAASHARVVYLPLATVAYLPLLLSELLFTNLRTIYSSTLPSLPPYPRKNVCNTRCAPCKTKQRATLYWIFNLGEVAIALARLRRCT